MEKPSLRNHTNPPPRKELIVGLRFVIFWGFPGGPVFENPPPSAGGMGVILGLGRLLVP